MPSELLQQFATWFDGLSTFDQYALSIVVPATLAVFVRFCHEIHKGMTNCLPHIAKSVKHSNKLQTALLIAEASKQGKTYQQLLDEVPAEEE